MITHTIFIERLSIDARIGILEHELRSTQPIWVDCELEVTPPTTINDHDIRSVLDYRQVRELIIEHSTARHIHLVETLGEQLVNAMLAQFPSIQTVRLRIRKKAFSDCDYVGLSFSATRPIAST